MSGAIFRLSWFISNSYSKSEMARSPFTIAFAPFARAKSTIRLENGSTVTLGRFCTSASMNSTRSSALNSVFCLRTGWATTATMTLSNTSATRRMMSRWPSVTGSYDPGQTATPPLRSAATVDGDPGVAVDALVHERQCQLERRALVRFGHGEGGLVENGGEQLGELFPQTGGGTIRRVGEHEVVRAHVAGEVGQRVLGADRCRWVADRAQVRADDLGGAPAGFDEHRLGRPARERLDPERPGAGVEVEHLQPADVAEDGEERLAD